MELNAKNLVNLDQIKQNSIQGYKNVDTKKLGDDALRKVTNDFEAFFMQQLLDISLKDTNFAGEGAGSDIVKGMYTQAISSESAGTIGISDMLYNFLVQRNK